MPVPAEFKKRKQEERLHKLSLLASQSYRQLRNYAHEVFGSVELVSFFKPDGDQMIGMGTLRNFDRDGKLVSEVTKESGLVVSYERL